MPDAAITGTSVDDRGQFNARSTAMSNAENNRNVSPFLDPSLYRKPEYHVFIYSVVDPRPADMPLMRHQPPLTKNLRIKECPKGERYVLVTSLAHPVNQPDINPMNDQRVTYYSDARRVAQDIVNPSNLTLDQDAVLRAENVFSEGEDYGKLGVFWSLNNPPTDEEISKAVTRKENHYRSRLNRARVLETSDPKALNAALTITDHVAADYFGEEFSWHRTAKKPASCSNCGESIKEGVAYHRNVDGIICVIDWKRTVEAGVKAMADVPESKRWKETKSPQGAK